MEPELAWLILKSIPGVGNYLIKRLIEQFKTPQNIFCADRDALGRVKGVSVRLANALRKPRASDAVRRDLDRVRDCGCRLVTLDSPQYPLLLQRIPDPPPILYVEGTLENLEPAAAIVGSRKATRYGLKNAHQLAGELAGAGFTIVSGGARGIDTAAHNGALAAQGRTITVLGSGLDRIYPPQNRALFKQIAANGAVVSEFPMNAAPEPFHFPQRNRIISGMTMGTVIVEAAQKSGSLITARLAMEQNREVFAVPGSIQSQSSSGTHRLIREGAKLIENGRDILDELMPQIEPAVLASLRNEEPAPAAGTPPDKGLPADQLRVLDALEPYAIHIDELTRLTGLAPAKLSEILLDLEINGYINQLPGKHFVRENQASR